MTITSFHCVWIPILGKARVHPKYADVILTVLHRTQSTRLALVHGDISPKNILRGPAGGHADAECAWYGDPAFDLAFA
jgi:aminoglycoside phosphotransferase (APT) family kinase protein